MTTLATRQPSETVDSRGTSRDLRAIAARLPRAPAMLVLTVAIVVLVVLTSRAESEVSAIDEREHIDHLIRASRGELIQSGHRFTQESLRELCSRGSEYIEWPECKPGRMDPADFIVGGVNAAGDRPFYYIVTGPTARLLRALTPGWESLVTWGRVLGAAWLLAGIYLALRAGEALGVARWTLVPALVLVAAVPVQLAASTQVTGDATAFLAGAALLFAGLWWERSGRGLWLLGGIGVVSVLFEPTNGLSGLVVLAYFALRATTSGRTENRGAQTPKRYAIAGGVVVLSLAVGLVGWERVEDARTPPRPHRYSQEELDTKPQLDPLSAGASGDAGLTAERLFGGETLFAMFPPVGDVAPPLNRSTGPHAVWYQTFVLAATLLMIGALLLAALRSSLSERSSVLGLATVIGLIVGATLMVLGRYQLYDGYDPVVGRLGLSALPAIALVTAAAVRGRVGRGLLVFVASGLYLTALWTLV